MDHRLFNRLNEDMPVFNERIVDGLPYHTLAGPIVRAEVDKMLRTACAALPEDFSFDGGSVCGPQETYRVITGLIAKSSGRPKCFDLAINDMYMAKYDFSLGGDSLTSRYQYLPIVGKGGVMHIGDRLFSILPVMGDSSFSVGQDDIFINLDKAVVTFKQLIHTVDVDGQFTSRQLVWSKLHNRGGGQGDSKGSTRISVGRVCTTMGHYLFAQYGVRETFRKHANCEIELLLETDFATYVKEQQIDLTKYHQVRSRGVKPYGFKERGILYGSIRSPLVMLIPKCKNVEAALDLACAFFYMVDYYPETHAVEELLDTWQWRVWMGFVLWGDELGHGKLVENVEAHLRTLMNYVDESTRNMLMDEEDIYVEDFYGLMLVMLRDMDRMLEERGDLGSMYGKSLLVNRYVLSDIKNNINQAVFDITNNSKKQYTARDYNRILGTKLNHATLTKLRNTSEKQFMFTASVPGDNRLCKLSIRMVKQTKAAGGGGRSRRLSVADPTNHLHESILEAGNYLVLPKKTPTGDSTINPTVQLSAKDVIVRKEHLREVIDYVGSIISRN